MFQYDPFAPEALVDPYVFYPTLRREYPIYRLEDYHAWALSRFEDCWRVLQDHEGFSITEGPVFSPASLAAPYDPAITTEVEVQRSFATWDAPSHTRIRRAMSSGFSPKPILATESEMRAQAKAALEALIPLGRFDVVTDFAGPFVLKNIADVVGLPIEDPHSVFRTIQKTVVRDPGLAGFTKEGLAAQAELTEQICLAVAEQRDAPRDASTVSALLDFELDGVPLTDLTIAIQLMTLLTGGTETLPKIFAGGLLELERHPDQRADLVADSQLSVAAFEEMMRHQGVLQHVGRTALRDFEIGGVNIPRGDRVILLLQAANRDEREFENGEDFDIHREQKRNLALGIGRHHCIGSHLARLEGRILIETMLPRLPGYQIDRSSMVRAASEFQVGYTAMKVEFDIADTAGNAGNTR
jgi:cytochrome P450